MMRKSLLWSLLLINIACVVALWWFGSGSLLTSWFSDNIMISLGRLTGLLAQLCLLMQLILVARISWIEHSFGFDRTVRLHRYIGYSVAALLVAHPVLLVFGYAIRSDRSLWEQLMRFILNWDDLFLAVLGVGVFAVVIFSSIYLVRAKLRYEWWYGVHILAYLAIGLTFLHQTNSATVSAGWPLVYWLVLNYIVFGLVLIYRFIKPVFLYFRHKFEVTEVRYESDDVVSVVVSGRHMEKFLYTAGQFAKLTFFSRGMLMSHPFSFSKAYDGKSVQFTVKALGDFTRLVKQLRPGTNVLIDGPLGLFTTEAAKTKNILFIAGGIGITPIHALAQELARKSDYKTRLFYACRRLSDAVFLKDLADLGVETELFLSDVPENKPGYKKGYISEQDLSEIKDLNSWDIYLCGPPVMMQSVRSILEKLNFPKSQLHFENFSF